MTQPAAPALVAVPPIVATPFSQVAIDAAIPKPPPVVETPDEQAALAAEPPPAETPAAPPPTGKTKQQEAREAADALVAKRKAARAARQTETSETARLAAERDEAVARAARAEAVAQEIERAPLDAVRKRGIPDKDIQQAAIDDASPEGRIARMERELAARDARDAERERTERARQATAAQTQAERAFVQQAIEMKVGEETAYPLLAARAKKAPGVVVAEAHAIIRMDVERQRAEGVPANRIKIPTNEDVYEYQEWLLQPENEASLPGTGAPPVVESAEAPAAPAPKKPNGVKTLSARRVPPAAAPKPYGQMTPQERLAHDAAQLRALHAK